jgi:hypothetical protein
VLLHPRDANPGHYDAIVALFGESGVEPRIELRDLRFDVAQTPINDGRAVAIVGESTLVSLPGELEWLPLSPPAVLPVALLARRAERPPAVDRLLAFSSEIADRLGWRDVPGT